MECNHIQDWAEHNSMIINSGKTKEIIFYNPRAIPSLTPLPIFGIKQVSSAKLLGVYIQGNLSCDMHFKHIITVASQRLHILKALRRQGLSLELLHCVFHAIIVNKISAWYGFLNKSHVLQIVFSSVLSSTDMSNLSSSLKSYCKIMMTTCSLKQLKETTPCIICFLVPSLPVTTYEHSVQPLTFLVYEN